MTAAAQLSQQLSQTSDALKATNTLITRLAKLSFPSGSEPLEGEGSVRIELAQDIHDSLKQLDEDLELLKQEAEDLSTSANRSRRKNSIDKGRDQARLSAQVARLEEDLRHSRSQFRRAQLSAKKASEAAKQRERQLVLANLSAPPPAQPANDGTSTPDLFAGRRKLAQQKQLTKGELEVDASSSVTEALRRTHDLLSTELSRSRFAQETFDQSTEALAELGEHYSNLESILSNSRNLLGTLLRSQKSDTWYLETAFYILLATLCWLIFRRILLGPFVRLPVFVYKLLAFALNWVVLKPLFLFLTATGVITTNPAGAANVTSLSSTTRTPLIIKPSATGDIPRISNMADQMPKGGIPAGAGGAGAKQGKDPVLEGQMSEQIGRMAEQSGRQGVEPAEDGKDEKELPRRADGTVLQERSEDVPRNPKKKMFEAQQQQERQQQERRRDEL